MNYSEAEGYDSWSAMAVANQLDKYGFTFTKVDNMGFFLDELLDRFGMEPGLDESRCRDGYYYLTRKRHNLL